VDDHRPPLVVVQLLFTPLAVSIAECVGGLLAISTEVLMRLVTMQCQQLILTMPMELV
jgi:hypothetical protein